MKVGYGLAFHEFKDNDYVCFQLIGTEQMQVLAFRIRLHILC